MGGLIILDLVVALSANRAYEQQSLFYTLLSCFAIIGACYMFIKLLRYKATAIANIIWIGGGTILVSLAGYFFLNEKLTTLQISGMTLIILGMIIIELKASA